MRIFISIVGGIFAVATLSAQPVMQTFNYTGTITTFTVPACVTSIHA